ncbi:MAG: DUF1269 domain-containing protein [Chloroflexi bacterium]|jgi:uncharacterized membrane protein|nr:DUF1269 domain-containing protein [Chloroflexota bacterium]
MSDIVVITFDTEDRAGEVRESIRKTQKSGFVSLDDSAVVVKDKDGKVHVKNEVDRGVKIGAVSGGFLGLFIGFLLMGPIGSLVIGALIGGGIGSLAHLGIQHSFIDDVSDELQPGTSALFIIVRDANPDVTVATLRQYEGNIYHTSLPPEAEEQLRRSMKSK